LDLAGKYGNDGTLALYHSLGLVPAQLDSNPAVCGLRFEASLFG